MQALDQGDASTDGYLAFPTSRLGTEHLVLAIYNEKQRDYEHPRGSEIGVVGTQDGTVVTIVPTADIKPGPDLPSGAHRGVPFSVSLQNLQTLQLTAEPR